MPKSMVSAEHYNAVKLERDRLKARVLRLERLANMAQNPFLDRNDYDTFVEFAAKLFNETPAQSLLIHDAEALEHWAKVLSSSLVEGVSVHRMMSEAASLRLQAEDAGK